MHNEEVMSIQLSVRMFHLRNYANDFNEIWYGESALKYVEPVTFWYASPRCKLYFT